MSENWNNIKLLTLVSCAFKRADILVGVALFSRTDRFTVERFGVDGFVSFFGRPGLLPRDLLLLLLLDLLRDLLWLRFELLVSDLWYKNTNLVEIKTKSEIWQVLFTDIIILHKTIV